MRTKRIERLLKLIQSLESGRSHTVTELTKVIGVSRRTVFRDLELLTRSGIRYTYDRETQRYAVQRGTLLPPITLSHTEAIALMLAARNLGDGRAPLDESEATAAGLKIESILPRAMQDFCGPIVSRMEVRPHPASDTTSVIDIMAILQSALTTQRKVRGEYDSYFDGRVINVVLHSYRLAYIHRAWYLIAHTEGVDAVRTYKLERFLAVALLDRTFTMERGFNLDEYFGNAWLMIRGDRRYHVVIRFARKVAGNVDEVAWHKTQVTSFEDDGSLLFTVDVDGIDEISWWVLGYGDQAVVLEPPELRDLIAARVKAMHAKYTEGNGRPDPQGT